MTRDLIHSDISSKSFAVKPLADVGRGVQVAVGVLPLSAFYGPGG